jgi:SAM-dependent methyltransferase
MAYEPDQHADSDWWRDHFSGLVLDLWQSIVPADAAARDAVFLQAHLSLPAGAKILDVPCGDGRVALEMASRGYQLEGVDISPGLIASARRRSLERGLAIVWHEGDMRRLPWNEEFDAAYCWGDSFGYFDEAGNRAFLAAAYRALKPGARFALEMQMIAEVLLPRFREEAAGERGGIDVRVRRSYEASTGRMTVAYDLERDGVRQRQTASYRIHTCREIVALLESAGFSDIRLCDEQGQPFQLGADRLRVVSSKNSNDGRG